MAQLEVYPQSDAFVLRTGVFALECYSEIRARNHRLRFTACCGLRRLGAMVFRSGDRAPRYRDETAAPSEWEQGVLPDSES